MSTTFNREVAMHYASEPGKPGLVFEMQMGMIDRGSELQWLSQYPHEAECCFPPLTGIEVLSERIEGAVIIITARLSLNLNSLTIEQVVGKRQKVVVDMCDGLQSEARRELHGTTGSGGGEDDFGNVILSGLAGELDAICKRKADLFN